MVKLQPVFLLPFIAYAFINPADLPYWAYLILHLIAFFFAVMVCHGELAKNRPSTQHLTSFYLIMSFGGMLGGMFNTFVAPFIFNGIYEYPIMIVAALLLRPWPTHTLKKDLLIQISAPVILIFIGWILYIKTQDLLAYFDIIVISLILLALSSYFLKNKPVAFAFTIGAIIFLSLSLHGLSSHTLYQERSFFGVLAVRESTLTDNKNQPEIYHELFHGTTKHGAQRLSEELATTPLTYYSRPGPMGQLFKEYDSSNQNWTIGVVGLGAGALVDPEVFTMILVNAEQWRVTFAVKLKCQKVERPIGNATLGRICSDPDNWSLISPLIPAAQRSDKAVNAFLDSLSK
jgi:hypothetical protein